MIEACIDYKSSGTNRYACFLVSNVNIFLTLNAELEEHSHFAGHDVYALILYEAIAREHSRYPHFIVSHT